MPDKRDIAASPAGIAPPARSVQAVEQIAREPWLEGCSRFFRDEKKWITEQHVEVCRVPAATFQEQIRAEYLRSLFRDLGYGAQIDEAGNVIAPIIFDKKQPYIAVTAHMDTVIAPRGRGDVSVQPDGTIDGPGVAAGAGRVALPGALARKYPHAAASWPWQWVFPATRQYQDRDTGERRPQPLKLSPRRRTISFQEGWSITA
jgi:hypothetical protein